MEQGRNLDQSSTLLSRTFYKISIDLPLLEASMVLL